jgi:ATP-binding cassette subfamily C protein
MRALLDLRTARQPGTLPSSRKGGARHHRKTSSIADDERAEGRRFLKNILIWTAVFSVFVNLLMLTGPLFMLQVYDRVLSSGSFATLTALFGLVTALFLFMGVLDLLRGKLMSRAGAKLESLFDLRLFRSSLLDASTANGAGLRALEQVRQTFGSGGPLALFDLPWTPFFLAIIFIFHWSMGALALFAGALFVGLAIVNNLFSRGPIQQAQEAYQKARILENGFARRADVVRALGMRESATERLGDRRREALHLHMRGHERTTGFSVTLKTLRLFFQSAMLALGAALAIGQEITPGMMIAASILMGRALAPIDQLVSQWPLMLRGLEGWRTLATLLDESAPPATERVRLPRPKGVLELQDVVITPPGQRLPTVKHVTLAVGPGDVLGVIGKSASGKSSLAQALVGAWPVTAGDIRLDGAKLDQYDTESLGAWLGYLPQDVVLFAGTVGENVARFGVIDDEAVVRASEMADAHRMILGLPDGYDTEVGDGGRNLSGGQRQRIALARALYKDPPLLVLDEPNANLDLQGERAVIAAIERVKANGQTVVVIAHRPSAIAACDTILVLDNGAQVGVGPRDEVLQNVTQNPGTLRERLKIIGKRR